VKLEHFLVFKATRAIGTESVITSSIVVKFELYELYFWLELYEL